MITCRVYLFTYKRNSIFKRAVNSLLAQTFTNWVCEVHNDDPNDKFPQEYINSLNDGRFTVNNHSKNLGTTASFEYAFKGCTETYASILEDDNWWEDTFLEEMVGLMDSNPSISIAWSNMNIWKESADNVWIDANKTLWPVNNDIFFNWPDQKQALGALHSTGAMIYKGEKAVNYAIPYTTLSNAVELVRERCFEYPIFLYSKPLANFSFTLVSSQSTDSVKWIATQIMMLASYIINCEDKKKDFKTLLVYYRNSQPSPIPVFFLATVYYLKDWRLLINLNPSDWFLTIRWYLINCFKINTLKGYLKSQHQTWAFLKSSTQKISRINDTI